MSITQQWWEHAALCLAEVAAREPAAGADAGADAEVAAAHAAYLYSSDEDLLDAMVEYVSAGCDVGHRTVVFATDARLRALQLRLADWDLQTSMDAHDAEQVLAALMVDGKPSPERFRAIVSTALNGHAPGSVRAYGEMVDLLWQQGDVAGTLALEELWNNYLSETSIPLLCAYSLAQVGDHPEREPVHHAHSRVLAEPLAVSP